MNFVVYDATGKILRTGNCPDDHMGIQAAPGQFVMQGQADDRLHIIQNGRIVPNPQPPKPEPRIRPQPPAGPSMQQQLNAIFLGGQAMADMKQKLIDAGLIKSGN